MPELPDFLGLPSEPKANILLVDDNPTNLLSLRSLLEDLGQNLVEARSGEETIELVKGGRIRRYPHDTHCQGRDRAAHRGKRCTHPKRR